MVDPRLCTEAIKPALARKCNRKPCPATWKELGWTACTSSTACLGVQKMRRVELNVCKNSLYIINVKVTFTVMSAIHPKVKYFIIVE